MVIGAGGLGHVAIQLLRELTPTRVIALDIGQDKLDFAKENGAHEAFTSSPEAAEKVKSLTGGRGATVVLDFVGADVTGDLAVSSGGVGSAVVVIGAGMGGAKVGLTSTPYNMTVSTSLWGRRKELLELVRWPSATKSTSGPRPTPSRTANRRMSTCTPARSSAERSWCPERTLPRRWVTQKQGALHVDRRNRAGALDGATSKRIGIAAVGDEDRGSPSTSRHIGAGELGGGVMGHLCDTAPSSAR